MSGAKRFMSRKLAEFNDLKLSTSVVSLKDMDEEMQTTVGPAFTRRTMVADQIKGHTKDAEVLRENLKEVYKAADAVAATMQTLSNDLLTLRKAMYQQQEYMSTKKNNEASTSAFAQSIQATEFLENGMKQLSVSMQRTVSNSLQTFVKTEVRETRYFAHEVLKGQLEYESSVTKLSQARKAKNKDPQKIFLLAQQFQLSQVKFDQVADEFMSKNSDMWDTNLRENSLFLVKHLRNIQEFFKQGNTTWDELGPKVENLEKELYSMPPSHSSDPTTPGAAVAQLPVTFQAALPPPLSPGPGGSPQPSFSSSPAPAMSPQVIQTKSKDIRVDFLVQLLSRSDLKLITTMQTLCPPERVDQLFSTYVYVLIRGDRITPLLHQLVNTEMAKRQRESTQSITTLWNPVYVFSKHPTASTILSYYLRNAAKYYLSTVLGPIVRMILMENRLLELDPDKFGGEHRRVNTLQLTAHVENILDNLMRSTRIMPSSLRMLCTHVAGSSNTGRDPAADVAALIFLQMICPALMNPGVYQIVSVSSTTGKEARRTLQLLSIIMRNLAKQEKFQGSESFMSCMDDCVQTNFSKMRDFCVSLAQRDDSYSIFEKQDDNDTVFTFPVVEQDLSKLVTPEDCAPITGFLVERKAQILSALSSDAEISNEVSALLRNV